MGHNNHIGIEIPKILFYILSCLGKNNGRKDIDSMRIVRKSPKQILHPHLVDRTFFTILLEKSGTHISLLVFKDIECLLVAKTLSVAGYRCEMLKGTDAYKNEMFSRFTCWS